MNKHDQSYKCLDSDCDKMQDFTYSDKLLCYQHEVHKMHIKSQKLICLYLDCNWSSEKGFTRKENLKEHLQHLHEDEDEDSLKISNEEIDEITVSSWANHSQKRKWWDFTVSTFFSDENNDNNNKNNFMSLQNEITRLHQEITTLCQNNKQKDFRLDMLKRMLKDLQWMNCILLSSWWALISYCIIIILVISIWFISRWQIYCFRE